MRLPPAFLALAVIVVATGADHSWDGKAWQCGLSTNAEQEACTGPDHADMANVVRACGKKNAHGWKHGSWSCSGSCAHPEHRWDDCLGESENCPIYDASDGLLACCKAGFSHESDTSYDCSTLAVNCTAFARHCVSDDVDTDGILEEFQFETGIPDNFTNAEVTDDMSALLSNIAVQYTQWQVDRSNASWNASGNASRRLEYASRRLEYQFGDALGTEHGDSTSGGGQATEQTCVFTDEHTDFSAPAGMEGASLEDLVTHMNAELVDEFDSGSVHELGKGNLNHLHEDECGFFIKEGTLDTSSVGLKVYFTKDLPTVDVDGTSCSFPTGNQKAIITQFYKASDITATRNTSVPLVKGLVAGNAGKLGMTDACAPFVDRVFDALRRGISKKRFEVAAALATTTSSA